MLQNVNLWAGKNAYAKIKDSGLAPDDVKVVAGAAGGPKWLILANLDRALFGQWFKDRKNPLFLIGASIGSWRFAAASQKNPVAAVDRLQDAYINQTYKTKPTPADVSREGVQRDILPIVEGSTISTKYGFIRTNHILFVASGAFHVSKMSRSKSYRFSK